MLAQSANFAIPLHKVCSHFPIGNLPPIFESLCRYHFRVLKNGATASVGFPLATRTKDCLRRRRRRVSSPLDPRRNQRLMIPILPLAGPRALGPNFLQRAKIVPLPEIFWGMRDSLLSSPDPVRFLSVGQSLLTS